MHALKSIFLALLAAALAACTATQPHPQANTSALATGDTAPDFTLQDVHGGTVTLSQLHKPTLLVFYLGYDCPRCVRHLRDLANHKKQFDDLGVQILALSPDTIATSRQSIADFGDFPFPLLSDPDHKTAAAYGLLLDADTMSHGIFALTPARQILFSARTDHPYENTANLLKQFQSAAP